MLGYREAREAYKKKYNKAVKTSSQSPKREGDYKYPCPDEVRPKLEKILKELKMI
jgi:hypothetical protein